MIDVINKIDLKPVQFQSSHLTRMNTFDHISTIQQCFILKTVEFDIRPVYEIIELIYL